MIGKKWRQKMRKYNVLLELRAEDEKDVEEQLDEVREYIVSITEKGMIKFKEWYHSYEHINQAEVAEEMKRHDLKTAQALAKKVGGILRTIYEPADDGVVYIIYKRVKKC